jgi:predicted phosphoribosyltransferase
MWMQSPRQLAVPLLPRSHPQEVEMRFRNREDAAAQLAARLDAYRGQHPLVLGVPRGAVPMARIIADALDGDLDVVLVRKLRAPFQPELAIGAVDEAGTVLEGLYFDSAGDDYVRGEIRAQMEILRTRRQLYAGAHPPIDPAGRVVIIVDDGVATGSSMLAAIASVRARKPQRIVVAIGVAPAETLARVKAVADEVVCLLTPPFFFAVGEFFEDFSEVTDAMVMASLARPAVATGRS